MPRIIRWILRDFKIQLGTYSEFILADIARFLVVSIHPPLEAMMSGITARWQTLNYLLEISKNDLVRSLIKQSIFYDWMFYTSKKDSVLLVEPGISLIRGTFYSNLNLCQELLDFLFIICKE